MPRNGKTPQAIRKVCHYCGQRTATQTFHGQRRYSLHYRYGTLDACPGSFKLVGSRPAGPIAKVIQKEPAE